MQHSLDTAKLAGTVTAKRTTPQEREEMRLHILDLCKKACDKGGGYAMIDDRYVFVDTKVFEVTQRETVQS